MDQHSSTASISSMPSAEPDEIGPYSELSEADTYNQRSVSNNDSNSSQPASDSERRWSTCMNFSGSTISLSTNSPPKTIATIPHDFSHMGGHSDIYRIPRPPRIEDFNIAVAGSRSSSSSNSNLRRNSRQPSLSNRSTIQQGESSTTPMVSMAHNKRLTWPRIDNYTSIERRLSASPENQDVVFPAEASTRSSTQQTSSATDVIRTSAVIEEQHKSPDRISSFESTQETIVHTDGSDDGDYDDERPTPILDEPALAYQSNNRHPRPKEKFLFRTIRKVCGEKSLCKKVFSRFHRIYLSLRKRQRIPELEEKQPPNVAATHGEDKPAPDTTMINRRSASFSNDSVSRHSPGPTVLAPGNVIVGDMAALEEQRLMRLQFDQEMHAQELSGSNERRLELNVMFDPIQMQQTSSRNQMLF